MLRDWDLTGVRDWDLTSSPVYDHYYNVPSENKLDMKA